MGAGDSVGLPGPSAVCADADDLQQSRRNFGLIVAEIANGHRARKSLALSSCDGFSARPDLDNTNLALPTPGITEGRRDTWRQESFGERERGAGLAAFHSELSVPHFRGDVGW